MGIEALLLSQIISTDGTTGQVVAKQANGSLALESLPEVDLSAYLPLAGGTMTGQLGLNGYAKLGGVSAGVAAIYANDGVTLGTLQAGQFSCVAAGGVAASDNLILATHFGIRVGNSRIINRVNTVDISSDISVGALKGVMVSSVGGFYWASTDSLTTGTPDARLSRVSAGVLKLTTDGTTLGTLQAGVIKANPLTAYPNASASLMSASGFDSLTSAQAGIGFYDYSSGTLKGGLYLRNNGEFAFSSFSSLGPATAGTTILMSSANNGVLSVQRHSDLAPGTVYAATFTNGTTDVTTLGNATGGVTVLGAASILPDGTAMTVGSGSNVAVAINVSATRTQFGYDGTAAYFAGGVSKTVKLLSNNTTLCLEGTIDGKIKIERLILGLTTPNVVLRHSANTLRVFDSTDTTATGAIEAGAATFSGNVNLPSGTSSTPALKVGSGNDGIAVSYANTFMNFILGGTTRLQLGSFNLRSAGTGSASAPSYSWLDHANAGLYINSSGVNNPPAISHAGNLLAEFNFYRGTLLYSKIVSYPVLTLVAHASQTANLQEWQNSAGTVLASLSAAGNLVAGAATFSGSVSTQTLMSNNGSHFIQLHQAEQAIKFWTGTTYRGQFSSTGLSVSGTITAGAATFSGTIQSTSSDAPWYMGRFRGNNGGGIALDGGGNPTILTANSLQTLALGALTSRFWANHNIAFANTNNVGGTLQTATVDVGIARNSAGVLRISDGSTGMGDLIVGAATFSGDVTITDVGGIPTLFFGDTNHYMRRNGAYVEVRPNDRFRIRNGITQFEVELSGNTTIAGILNLPASTTSRASINIPDGVAPTTPVDGDMWCVGDILYRRIGGVTKSLTFV